LESLDGVQKSLINRRKIIEWIECEVFGCRLIRNAIKDEIFARFWAITHYDQPARWTVCFSQVTRSRAFQRWI
jgi:hypothetical protein